MELPTRLASSNGFLLALGLALLLVFGAFAVVVNGSFASLVAAVSDAVQPPALVVFFAPSGGMQTLTVGDTATLDLDVDAHTAINAFGATIRYPHNTLDIVAFSKEHSFLDLWTQDTTLNDTAGELAFSGGTTMHGGITGTTTALTITVRAEQVGDATLSLADVSAYAADGKGTSITPEIRSLTFHIVPVGTTTAPETSSGSGGGELVPQPTAPSPDLNGDGKVTLLDVSKLLMQMVQPYNPRYDLDMNGTVGLTDLSVLFSKMGTRP